MRISRARVVSILLAGLAGLAAAGCGGSSPGTTASTAAAPAATTAPPATTGAVSPRERLGAALRALQATSYRATIRSRQTFESIGAPEAIASQLRGVVLATRGTTAVESVRRTAGQMQVPLSATTVRDMHITQYDGEMFISRDGRDWRTASGELASTLGETVNLATQDLASHLTGVRAAGRTTFAGAPAERYVGAIDPEFVVKSLGSLFERLGLDPDLVGVEASEGSFIVRASDGAVLAQDSTQAVSLDLSKLPGGLDGKIVARGVTTIRYTDHGDPIRVMRPEASGTLSTPAELSAFLVAP
jgi:hypothetical protein